MACDIFGGRAYGRVRSAVMRYRIRRTFWRSGERNLQLTRTLYLSFCLSFSSLGSLIVSWMTTVFPKRRNVLVESTLEKLRSVRMEFPLCSRSLAGERSYSQMFGAVLSTSLQTDERTHFIQYDWMKVVH